MCGRIVYVWDAITGKLVKKLVDDSDADPEVARVMRKQRYNVPPASHLPVISMGGATNGERGKTAPQVEVARWGFPIPQRPNGVFNTRIEKAAGSPMWSPLLGQSHCLFFVKGFYEWKPAHFIHRADGRPMLLAGLVAWRNWKGEAVRCASVVTCEPNDLVQRLHDRMPVVIEEADAKAWLTADLDGARRLAVPAGEGVLAMHQVSDRVNSTQNDDADLIRPVGQTTL